MYKAKLTKRVLKLLGVIIITPIVLFLLLAILIYLPPVQTFIKNRATAIMSEKTGCEVTIDNVRLYFPLDLNLNGTTIVQRPDTLLAAKTFRVGVRVVPLFRSEVSLDGVHLLEAKVNSKDFISNTQVKGHVGSFDVDIPAVWNMKDGGVELGAARLANSRLSVLLCDTAKKDTTTSEPLKMTVRLHKTDIQNTSVYLQMPGDSMRIGASMKKGEIREIDANLETNSYKLESLQVTNGKVNYDVPYEKKLVDGFDYNHLALKDLKLKASGISYVNDKLAGRIDALSFKEQCGFQLDDLHGAFSYDSTQVGLKDFMLKTPYTELNAAVSMPMSVLKDPSEGKMSVEAHGSIGRQDVVLLGGDMLKDYQGYYPNEPLEVKAHLTGNMKELNVHELEAKLGNVAHVKANGLVRNVMNNDLRYTDLQYNIKVGDPSFYKKMLPAGVKIPANLLLGGRLKMNGNELSTSSTFTSGKGKIMLNGKFNIATLAYEMLVKVHQFPVRNYMPALPLSPLTATARLKGRGMDFLAKGTRADVMAYIQQFAYDKIPLNGIKVDAVLKDWQLDGNLTSNNSMLKANTNFTADISKKDIKATLKGCIEDLAIDQLTGGNDSIHLMMDMKMRAYMNNAGTEMKVMGLLEHTNVTMPDMGFPVDSIGFIAGTCKDSTYAVLRSGDFKARMHSPSTLDNISEGFSAFIKHIQEQVMNANIDQQALKGDLPTMELSLKSGSQNAVAQFLAAKGYEFQSLRMDLKSDAEKGLQGDIKMKAFRSGNMLLDETTAKIVQDTSNLKLSCAIQNTSKKNPNKFHAKVDGELLSNGFSLMTLFKDAEGREGLHFGLKGEMSAEHDLTMHIVPQTSTIAYRKFKVNKDNFITITPDRIILADVDLLADDHTGLKIVATREDTASNVNDITLSLSRVNIDELCSVLPYMPSMGGFFDGDFHIIREDDTFSASGDLELNQFRFESYNMGDFSSEMVFLPKENDEYYLNALILSDNKEVASFDGTYYNGGEGAVSASVNLEKFPCKLLNAFMPTDGTLSLDGYANGEVKIEGPVSKLIFNGNVLPDSLQIQSPLYGMNMRMEDKPLRISENCLYMDTLSFYSTSSKNPLTINGSVNFMDFEKILIDLGVKARNFQIVSSQRTKSNVLFGKVYSDIDVNVKGSTSFMFIKGNLNVLSNTDMTYIMKDGPLAVEDWLSGIVEFVDFSDTTTVENEAAAASKIMMNLGIDISEKAKIRCELSPDGNSYFNCKGGGHLTMKYMPSGEISLLGTFAMSEGEMKYELPFIPMKTFKLSGDNYITFNGKPMNPTLHITALETTRASVSDGSASTRMVTFNVGVAITQTLEDMGLQFIIDAPNDMNVQNELAAMSPEDKNKLAISMLATGMYLSSSNNSSFKANNALNSFLQSEIQNLAGNTLKSINLTVGMEGSTTSTGKAQTDYSFQFSKHLWDDRVTIVIGGKVSAGSSDTERNQSFIDNISLEYRLDKNSTRNVRIFYDSDSQDPLEGTYSTAGAGFILRSKTNTLGELFLKPRKPQEALLKE